MSPKEKGVQYKELLAFIALFIIGGVLLLFYLGLTGNENQVFTDVINEWTSRNGSNKSAERNLFYIFSIGGAVVLFFIYLKNRFFEYTSNEKGITADIYAIVAVIVAFAVELIVYSKVNYILLIALIVVVVSKLKDSILVVPAVSFFFISLYGFLGIYRLYVLLGGQRDTDILTLSIVAGVVTVLFVCLAKEESLIRRGILISQLIVPFTLLMFLASAYKTSTGDIVRISVPKRVSAFIIVLLLLFIAEATKKLLNNWSHGASLQDILAYGTCVSIMTFNRYSGVGSIADLDWHHNFENVIGFSQIFELGQTPFDEYIPVSGLYSVIHGFFLWFFGHGLAGYYYVTTNLFYLCIILAIVFLAKKQLKAEWVLFLSVFLYIADYNRIALIIPTILLLTWPDLIDKKNLWLKMWLLSSLVHGLFYPVFGAAVCLGFLPLGIWQIYSYASSGRLSKDIKTKSFWLGWVVTFIPVLFSAKLLLGTLKHMLAMGAQTIYSDGYARFGQCIRDDFFSYIGYEPVRVILYYMASYMILISIVWLGVAVAMKCGRARIAGHRLSRSSPVGMSIGLLLTIMFLVAFSYTVVRLDPGDIYSRSAGLIKAALVIVTILVARYFKNNDKSALWFLGFAVFFISLTMSSGIDNVDNDSKLSAVYTVPENDIYLVDTNIRLGECFMDSDSYVYLTGINQYYSTLDQDADYLGLVDSFGLDYLNNIKGGSVMEIFNTIRGYGATEETVDLLRNNYVIVGRNINPTFNYYLYHWLMTSGEYVWDESTRLFIPNVDNLPLDEVLARHKYLDLSYGDEDNYEATPGSWGTSMEALEDIFSDVFVLYTINQDSDVAEINLDNGLEGDDADFVYIDFGDLTSDYSYCTLPYGVDNRDYFDADGYGIFKNLFKKVYNPGKTVVVSWNDENGDEHTITCDLDEGKLLIPLGTGTGWLLNNHTHISIKVLQDGETISTPDINKIRFLKLQEIE